MKFLDRDGNEVQAPDHLRDQAPTLRCNLCGRKTWTQTDNGKRCGMTQPTGRKCDGIFEESK